MATVVRENIGLLHDKLVVKLTREDYYPSFDKKLKEYSKTANIPGFRKGMVPAGMIKKMYGSSIFTDVVLKSVEKELYGYLQQEKPEIFGQPLPLNNTMRNPDINQPSEYEFEFEIGVKPGYTLTDLTKANFTLHKVEVTDAMVDEEISRMRVKAGKMTDQEIIDNEENILNILFRESNHDGAIQAEGITKENSVLIKYFKPAAQKQIMGKKAGDTINIQLGNAFDKDALDAILHDLGLDKNDEEAPNKYFNLEIVKIGMVEKRELDETFFKEIYPGKDIATEEELRTNLREEMQQYWDEQSRRQLHDQLYHYLIDETSIQFPEDFLKRWLQHAGEQTKTAEQAEAEFPRFSTQLKWTLISDKLISDNQLEVNNEELREYMKTEVMRYFGTTSLGEDTSWLESYIDRMMKDEKQVDASYRRLITDKLFNWAEGQITTKEKTVTPEELTAMQHNHQH